ncbi:MAG TPA: hypothetical protein VF824_15660 [Thermoanaerobaculia bacterium]|jgi:hypothetical protein
MSATPGAAFVLKSGVYPGPTPPAPDVIAAAADGSLWIASQQNLLQYSRETGAFATMYSATADLAVMHGIAPVDYQHVYFLGSNASGAAVVGYYQQSGVTTLAALPGSDTAAAITAAPDGTLWVTGASGTIYAHTAGGWTTLAAPSGGVTMLSAGSATFGLALVGGGTSIAKWDGTSWSTLASQTELTFVAACADGSYWTANVAAAAPGAAQLTLVLPDASTVAFAFPNEIVMPGYLTAASRYACFFLGIDLNVKQMGLGLAAYGVMEQPAENWPAMDANEQAAYTAITNAFLISDPAGFRSVYANLNDSLSENAIELSDLACPSGIDATAFASVKSQLIVELRYADSVRNLFTNLATLNSDLALEQTQTYASVVEMVGLPDQPSQQPNTPVQVIFGNLLSKLLDKAISLAPDPAQSVISLGMSVFNHVADLEAQQSGGTDRNSALTVACSQLAGMIASVTSQTLTTTSTWESTILADWGMLQACGNAIATGAWYWPPTFVAAVIKGSGAAMELDFYQILVPVKWQIMNLYALYVPGIQPTPSTPPNAPQYSFVYQTVSDSQGAMAFWYWMLTEQGVSPDLDTTGPFPNQQLVLALITADAGDENDLFTNANGWNLPVVQGGTWTAPMQGVAFQPWVNSTSPL